jgi:DNA-binding transcriptional ArsR family regulator
MAVDLRMLVEQLKAAAHPIRLRVLALLERGEFCVCQIAEVLQAPQSSISETIRELRRAGFITERKEGRWVFVAVTPEATASPLLRALLEEATTLPEVVKDRARGVEVRTLPIPIVYGKRMKETMEPSNQA